MVTDQIADLITRIRNAQRVGHPTVTVPASNTKQNILDVLCREGYIVEFEKVDASTKKPSLKVHLKYDRRGEPVIKEIRRMSSPGRRQYVGKEAIPQYKSGLGTVVISTSKGMVTGKEAAKLGLGGELICAVF